MKLENQVVSLELSKELKEAGYKQEGLWWWNCCWSGCDKKGEPYTLLLREKANGWEDWIAAPTIAELFEQLPKKIGDKTINVHKVLEGYEVYATNQYGASYERFDYNLANAMAKMYLYLKKERLL